MSAVLSLDHAVRQDLFYSLCSAVIQAMVAHLVLTYFMQTETSLNVYSQTMQVIIIETQKNWFLLLYKNRILLIKQDYAYVQKQDYAYVQNWILLLYNNRILLMYKNRIINAYVQKQDYASVHISFHSKMASFERIRKISMRKNN